MEKRVVKLERAVEDYGRRITDNTEKINEIINWQLMFRESIEVNKRMVEVGEGIIEALGWVGKASKWVIAIGGAFTTLWFGVKHILMLRI